MIPYEIIRSVVHALQEYRAFVNNDGSVAPGKKRRKQTGNFYVLFFGEPVRNGNGVERNKRGVVVFLYLPV